jgi:hypothetical protein
MFFCNKSTALALWKSGNPRVKGPYATALTVVVIADNLDAHVPTADVVN